MSDGVPLTARTLYVIASSMQCGGAYPSLPCHSSFGVAERACKEMVRAQDPSQFKGAYLQYNTLLIYYMWWLC